MYILPYGTWHTKIGTWNLGVDNDSVNNQCIKVLESMSYHSFI